MFFIMGVSQEEKKLDFDEFTICKYCEKYGHVEVYISYWYFMFFFIPLFKWNKTYFVKMTCCNKIGKLNNEIGRKIEKKEKVSLDLDNIEFIDLEDRNYFNYDKSEEINKYIEDLEFEKKKIEQGKKEKAIEIAKELLDVLPIEVIAQKTGLTIEEIKNLKK